MTTWQRWSVILGSTLVLWVVSERVFWSLIRPDDEAVFFFVGIIPYLVATYCMFLALQYFRVSTVAGVLLGGDIFGWITEGIVAMTIFGGAGIALPLSLSWTGLSWHMLLSVGLFWWWHRILMRKSLRQALLFSVIFGITWGLWSMTWFLETPPIINSSGQYFAHAIGITLLMIVGHILMGRQVSTFETPRTERVIILTIVALYFCVITVPTVTVMAVLIPLLAFFLYIPLRHNKARYEAASVIAVVTQKIPLRSILTLLVAPLIATFMYAFMLENNNVIFPFNLGFLFVTAPLGFAVLAWAWWRTYKGALPTVALVSSVPLPTRP